jgi:hypothetical protein
MHRGDAEITARPLAATKNQFRHEGHEAHKVDFINSFTPFVAFVLFVLRIGYATKKLRHSYDRLQRKALHVL